MTKASEIDILRSFIKLNTNIQINTQNSKSNAQYVFSLIALVIFD